MTDVGLDEARRRRHARERRRVQASRLETNGAHAHVAMRRDEKTSPNSRLGMSDVDWSRPTTRTMPGAPACLRSSAVSAHIAESRVWRCERTRRRAREPRRRVGRSTLIRARPHLATYSRTRSTISDDVRVPIGARSASGAAVPPGMASRNNASAPEQTPTSDREPIEIADCLTGAFNASSTASAIHEVRSNGRYFYPPPNQRKPSARRRSAATRRRRARATSANASTTCSAMSC